MLIFGRDSNNLRYWSFRLMEAFCPRTKMAEVYYRDAPQVNFCVHCGGFGRLPKLFWLC